MSGAILTGTYNPSEVICVVGSVILSGFSDGDAIAARRSEDVTFMRVGIDGGVGRARNANKSGIFEFRLLQTSKVNALLSAITASNDLVNDGLSVFPISIVDGSGTSLAAATQCWVKSIPEVVDGKEVNERVWEFYAADLGIFEGGNNI